MAALILFVSVKAFADNLSGGENALISIGAGLVCAAILFVILTLNSGKKETASIALAYAGLTGAFTNTLFVMSGIFILYKDAYANALGIAGDTVIDVISGVISFNGIVEAVVAAILVSGIGLALLHIKPIKA